MMRPCALLMPMPEMKGRPRIFSRMVLEYSGVLTCWRSWASSLTLAASMSDWMLSSTSRAEEMVWAVLSASTVDSVARSLRQSLRLARYSRLPEMITVAASSPNSRAPSVTADLRMRGGAGGEPGAGVDGVMGRAGREDAPVQVRTGGGSARSARFHPAPAQSWPAIAPVLPDAASGRCGRPVRSAAAASSVPGPETWHSCL